jgi:hypothetical protein
MQNAISDLNNNGYFQPLLLRCNKQYYVKVDSNAINLTDCSCFADAVEFVYMCFYAFNVEYPNEHRLFYAFIEHMLGTGKISGKSSTLSLFIRHVMSTSSH